MRYYWKVTNLPTTFPCKSKLDIQYSMSRKESDFISIRYNNLRDLTANMMSEL